MDLERLVIADPSGNKTAIVFNEIAPEDMHDVGSAIQNEYPSVEQVLFVQKKGAGIHAQMAGGEFCANAARALGYILANGEDGKQTFTMSGLSAPVTIDVSRGASVLNMETALTHEQKMLGGVPVPVVHLEGISHAVLFPGHPLYVALKEKAARPDRNEAVLSVLQELGLASRPASGLIFVESRGSAVRIAPYVYVRDIETLYAENSCASGSIAVASVIAQDEPEDSVKMSIHQPSEEVLRISLRQTKDVVHAKVAGSMCILSDGRADNILPPHPALATVSDGTPLPVAKFG